MNKNTLKFVKYNSPVSKRNTLRKYDNSKSSYESPYSVKNTAIKSKANKFKDPELLALADLLTNRRCDVDSTGIIRSLMTNKQSHKAKLQCLTNYKVRELELLAKFLHLPTHSKPPNPNQKDQKPTKIYKLKEELVKDLVKVIYSHLYQTCQTCQTDYKNDLDGEEPLLSCLICTRGCHNPCERTSLDYNTNLSASRRDLFICYQCYLDNAETTKINRSSTKGPKIETQADSEPYKTPLTTPIKPRTRNVTLEDSLFSPSTPERQPAALPTLSQIPLPPDMELTEPQRHSPPNLSSLIQVESPDTITTSTLLSKATTKSESPSHPANSASDVLPPPPPDNCPDYIRGCCDHGISGKGCAFPHRKRCNRFCRNGPHPKYGCSKGSECTFFHPELCKFSVRNRVCLNLSCIYTHLKFTRRVEYTNSKHPPAAPNRPTKRDQPLKFSHRPPVPVYQAPHISQAKTSNWDPLIDPLNEQSRKIENEQDFVQRSQFTKLELIKEEMRQEMKLWQESILAPMQLKLKELTLLLKERQPALPALFPHPTTSSTAVPHPHAVLYNIPPQTWYPRHQNPAITSQCQLTSTPNQSNPQLLNHKLPQFQAFPRFSY